MNPPPDAESRADPAPDARGAKVVLAAYRQGLFPMAVPARPGGRPELGWYEADPRGVIPLDAFHLPRRLARTIRSARFVVRCDTDFSGVIRACADPRRPGGWIDGWIIDTFCLLHRLGHAHSVEAWRTPPEGGAPVLVGGLYGLVVGAAFCAESMFSRPDLGGRDASKVCLAHLVAHLRRRGFALLDTQAWSDHLARFGCVEIARAEYRRRLRAALALSPTWGRFDPDRTLATLTAKA
ncbi:MAG: leucyl/phenylalanyl-tRNA--protein transferase [Phycisphaerales bacterium]|nr:leucyl/phenylalanyl-tRNA--protein transferase [Phycisphaerales bacterium]